MVCVPCFIIPAVLFFWRWLIQPFFLKYIWNPWEKKDEQGNVIKDETPEFIKHCEGGVCTFARKPVAASTENEEPKDQTTKKNE